MKLSRGSWIVTVPLVAAAAAYLVFVFLPGRREIGELQDEITRKQDFVGQSAGLATALNASQQELDRVRAFIENWRKRGPADGDRAALYARIHELVRASGAATTRFDPKPVIVRGQIREIPMTMGCSGKFEQVCELVRSLENLPMGIWVDSVAFKRDGENRETVACEINVVVFTDNSEASG